MKNLICIISLILSLPLIATAQETTGSIINPLPPTIVSPSIHQPDMRFRLTTPALTMPNMSLLSDSTAHSHRAGNSFYEPIAVPPVEYPREEAYSWHGNVYSHDFSRSGAIKTWDGGFILGASSYRTMPGLATIGAASIGVTQNLGNWTLSTGISAEKYNFPHSNYNNFGLNASATFHVNSNVSFSAFGNYSTNAIFNSMASMPYISQSVYGGYMTLITNNQKWGVDLGAQRYYDPYSHRWITVPIVQPYYLYHGQKIGLDFGGLIYNLFQSLDSRNNQKYYPMGGNSGNFQAPGTTINRIVGHRR